MLEFRETANWGAYQTLKAARYWTTGSCFDGFTSETQQEVACHVWTSLQEQTHNLTTVLSATASWKGFAYVCTFDYSEDLKLHVHCIFIVSKAKDELPQAVRLGMVLCPLLFTLYGGNTLLHAVHDQLRASTLLTEVRRGAEANRGQAAAVLAGCWSTCSVRRGRAGGATLGGYAVANDLWAHWTTRCLILLALLLELLCVEESPSWSTSPLHGMTMSRLMKVWLWRKETL